ncbi:MAG TPA: serine/threonine-protein kinase [Acidobacteriaceae bacterium]|nr:serine/threonine-protein kinase [Acidobacteriaceae bacterium]
MGTDQSAANPQPQDELAGSSTAFAEPNPLPGHPAAGTIVGLYQLVRPIGEGGMGEVWLAEQKEPVRRRVAIKLIKAGMDTREVIARFESERQALALMNHPSIAKVFDAGSTAEGRPYFVMEYVAGMPITAYCDRHRLTTRQRLKLLVAVCEGVQHAHQKAIIHRDLKPSNILVSEVDGKPIPQIIDFGVAKAIAHRLHDGSVYTQVGSPVGTLGYISPEQADSGGEDIDTRSDVYSLGVVLYELLCGTLPFDFRKVAWHEVLLRLREEDAPSPSTRFRVPGENSAFAAKNRGTELDSLFGLLHGDLDAITLRALEKDRGRRYSTPMELAADISRYLNNQAVLARSPSAVYRAGKYIRRHRLGVTLVTLLVLLGVIFALAQTIELRSIRRERDRADRISDFLTNMFRLPAPSEARGNTVTVREILDRSSDEIERGLDRDPVVRSQLMMVMARTYENLGLFSRAHALLERVVQDRAERLGANNPMTLEARSLMGWVVFRQGRDSEAESLLRATIDDQTRVLGSDDPATLESRDRLARILLRQAHYDQVEKLERDLIDISGRRQGPNNPQALQFMGGLAIALAGQNRFAEAEKEYRELLDRERSGLGPDHPDTLATVHDLASFYLNQGNYEEAEKLYRENLEIEKRILGPEHPDTANSMTSLANTIRFSDNRRAEAEGLYRKSLEIERRVVGADHSYTTGAEEGLANLLSDEQRYPEAEALLRQVFSVRQRLLGSEHTDTLLSQYNLATVLKHEERYAEAEALTRSTLQTQERVLDANDPDTSASRSLLADILLREQRPEEAEYFARRAFNAQLRTLGQKHQDTLESLGLLGDALTRTGRYDDAKKLYTDSIGGMAADQSYAAREGVVDLWYDLACLAVRSGHRDEAFAYLGHAVDSGYNNVPYMRSDNALKSLRSDPRFNKVVARATTTRR